LPSRARKLSRLRLTLASGGNGLTSADAAGTTRTTPRPALPLTGGLRPSESGLRSAMLLVAESPT